MDPGTAPGPRSRWTSRASTARVNEVAAGGAGAQPAAAASGTLHYATQVSTGPPIVRLFRWRPPTGPGYRRFLENRLREVFDLEGVPIRLRFRHPRPVAGSPVVVSEPRAGYTAVVRAVAQLG